ncbi:MAG: ribonuclease [Actinomycetota bacterium]|nr:ribonuclease [Actinomycetota bacterium]
MFDTDGPRPKPAPPPSRPVLVVPRPHPPRRGRSLRMVTAGLVLAAGTLISPAVALARSAPEHLSASLPSDTADAAEDGVVALQFWRCLGFPRTRDWYTWQISAPGVGTVRTKAATDRRGPNTARGPASIRSLPVGQEPRLTGQRDAGRRDAGRRDAGRPVARASAVGPAALGSVGVASSRTSAMVRSIEGVYAFAGGRYRNHEARLPLGTMYYEYDVYPRNRGTARDGYRLVVDTAGETAWFTPNHYLDFYRVA